MEKETKTSRIRTLLHYLYRNYPDGATTWGPCYNKDKPGKHAGGRGSGLCIHCIEKEFAKIVGEKKADELVSKYHDFIQCKHEVLDAVEEMDEKAELEEA